MKLKLTVAPTFNLDPNKDHVCFIATDLEVWTMEQRAKVEETLGQMNTKVIWLPRGSKFKISEAENGQERQTTDAAKAS